MNNKKKETSSNKASRKKGMNMHTTAISTDVREFWWSLLMKIFFIYKL